MRIALLHPCYWPEVRRGSERLVHDLGSVLAERGHEVTLITSHPGASRSTLEDGMRIIRSRRPPRFSPLRWYEDHLDSVPATVFHLLRGSFDLAHAFQPAYAWGAAKARALGGPPFAFSFHGIPERGYLVGRRYRLEMLKTAITAAARVTVLSEAAADPFRRYLLAEPDVLPGGVLASEFRSEVARSDEPMLVCAASLGDPRKRAELLFGAFSELRKKRPDARLRVVHTRDPFLSPLAPSLPEGAEWVAADATQALADAYASAHASVLTSAGEAFGLVVLESLAAGTPVVAAKHGAAAELIEEGRTGELFEADDEQAVAAAMERGLDLGVAEQTAAACRDSAERYDWEQLAGRYEELYRTVAAVGEAT